MAKKAKPSKSAKHASKPAKKAAKHPAHTHKMPARPPAKHAKRAPKASKATHKAPAKAAHKAPAKAVPPTPAPAPKPANALAARMAAFSAKVLQEEEKPVAVQSFIEARAGQKASKQYLPKTGKVQPAVPAVDEGDDFDDDDDEDIPSPMQPAPAPAAAEDEDADDEEFELVASRDATGEPRTNPMTGQMSVPRDNETSFAVESDHKQRLAKKGKKGKKGVRPEEFGLVDLRQATASGGKHLARVKPENLQEKGNSKIRAITAEPDAHQKKRAPDRFEVSMDKRSGPKLPDLSDFGEVEIGQQTLSGSRKVGTLTPEEAKKRKAPDEE